GVQGGEGALVTSVRDESPAAKAGLQAGDVIVALGGESVGDLGDVVGSVRGAEAGPMEVEVMRDGQRRTLTVVLEELEEGECENVFFSPRERHSFEWHSDGDHSFVMPTPRAFAPQLRTFRFGAPMMPLHGLAPMPLHPASPGEVSVPPAPPPAPAPPAHIV
ncbi:MAG: PDZ domain-containing protein, partial [Gemmatimonadota bacterium]